MVRGVVRGKSWGLLFLGCSALLSGGAAAESSLVLPGPPSLQIIPASTYDLSGHRIGPATLATTRQQNGSIRINVETGSDSGARTVAHADLTPVDDGNGLRLLREQSQSYDDQGKPLVLLHIDHARGEATCTPPPGSKDEEVRVALPSNDRIANVPLNLLFLPLVQGEVEQLEFQYFLCRGGARVMDFKARLGESTTGKDGRSIIEVSYGPDLSKFVSWLAKALTPKLSFWFESGDSFGYLAHRMPLYSKGPEVMVIRDGLSPASIAGRP